MTTTVINAGTVLCLDDANNSFAPGHIVIDGATIVGVGAGHRSGGRVIDRSDHLVMPGLINAHTHTPMSLMRGAAEGRSLLTLDGWYDTIRLLELNMVPEMLPAATELSLVEMLTSGTTTFADQYFYLDAVVPVIERSGMRAALAYGIVELDDPVARSTEVEAARRFLAAGGDHPLIKRWVGPHAFFVDNKAETIELEVALAADYDTGIHAHFSTFGEEDEIARAQYGMSALAKLAELGALDQPLLLAHSLIVDTEDYSLLARSPATMVMAASVCMASGAPAPAMRALLDAGINVAIGSDNVCNTNSYDLFEEMRTLSRLMSYREAKPAAVSPHEVLWAATRGGAIGLGLDDEIGSLEVGKAADLVGLDARRMMRGPWGAQSLASAVVFGGRADAVTDVMVAGELLVSAGEVTTELDRDRAQRDVDDNFNRLASSV